MLWPLSSVIIAFSNERELGEAVLSGRNGSVSLNHSNNAERM